MSYNEYKHNRNSILTKLVCFCFLFDHFLSINNNKFMVERASYYITYSF